MVHLIMAGDGVLILIMDTVIRAGTNRIITITGDITVITTMAMFMAADALQAIEMWSLPAAEAAVITRLVVPEIPNTIVAQEVPILMGHAEHVITITPVHQGIQGLTLAEQEITILRQEQQPTVM